MENIGGNNPNHTPQPVWLGTNSTTLDINRRPYLYPDWTHTNAVIYSKDDGNLIISIRHQNWLVKIDYNNGAGAGDILWSWRLLRRYRAEDQFHINERRWRP